MSKTDDVLISIKTKQFLEDGTPDSIEMLTGGRYSHCADGFVITYDETDPDTSGNIKTTVTVSPDKLITVLREGEIHSQMIFEQGRKHLVHYDTAYGSLTVGISAHKVNTKLDCAGGDIEIDYAIEVDNAVTSENRLKMNISRTVKS